MSAEIFLCLSFLFFLTITAKDSGLFVSQSPRAIYAGRGESVSMTCEITFTLGSPVSTHFKRNHLMKKELCFVTINSSFVGEPYRPRLECNGTKDAKRINITLRDLQKNDTDTYYCVSEVENGRTTERTAEETMLIVSDETKQPCKDNCAEGCSKVAVFQDPLMIAMIILAVASFCFALVLLLRHGKNHYQVEQSKRKGVPNSVYEDMNLRRKHLWSKMELEMLKS
ncbi:uncharacterized protein LOC144594902 [Rhinoraja longicauda]